MPINSCALRSIVPRIRLDDVGDMPVDGFVEVFLGSVESEEDFGIHVFAELEDEFGYWPKDSKKVNFSVGTETFALWPR